jgi:membrane protease YdiL (CAAX protease family)
MYSCFFSNKSYWQQLLYLLLFIVGGITIFSSLALLIVKLTGSEINTRHYIYVIQSVVSLGSFLVPALLFSYCATKDWFSYSKFNKLFPVSFASYVVLLAIFVLPVIAYLGYINEQIVFPKFLQNMETWMRDMEESSKLLLKTLTADSTFSILLLNILLMGLLPALFEEFLFRGTLQPFLAKWFAGKHLAIIITAFIFSAIHFQFFGFIPRFLLGIYLGYLFVWGNSLWLPILAHFLHNTLSIIGDYFAQRNSMDLDAIDPSQLTAFYPTVLSCTICTGCFIYLLWKKSINNRLN